MLAVINDELGAMGKAMNAMLVNLMKVMSEVCQADERQKYEFHLTGSRRSGGPPRGSLHLESFSAHTEFSVGHKPICHQNDNATFSCRGQGASKDKIVGNRKKILLSI
ncbi:MAG: hypothetical protein AB7P17_03095 [Nitrospirales bacterium]